MAQTADKVEAAQPQSLFIRQFGEIERHELIAAAAEKLLTTAHLALLLNAIFA